MPTPPLDCRSGRRRSAPASRSTLAGTRLVRELPVQYRYEGPGLVGEKRMELNVVPAFAVSVSPQIVVVPRKPGAVTASAAAGRELRVTVTNGAKGPSSATVSLKTPAGWRVSPATAAISFTREDESTTTRFTVTPTASAKGEHEISAEVLTALPKSIRRCQPPLGWVTR